MSVRTRFLLGIILSLAGLLGNTFLWVVLPMKPQDVVSQTLLWWNNPWARWILTIIFAVLICAAALLMFDSVPSLFSKKTPSPFIGPAEELIKNMSPIRPTLKLRWGMYKLGDGDRITTKRFFRPPVAFRLVAKTNCYELRFAYVEREMILNWGGNPNEFRIGEVPGTKEVDKGPFDGKHVPHKGRIPTDTWVQVDVIATLDSFTVLVDGDQRFYDKANLSTVNQPFVVYTCGLSTIHVKSLKVGKPA